ncbi:MAG TPA: ABC transporter substrate-binding protein [Acetobacteraceae bacterium]|nr:ABC transporter substrate-binding protein [Acetobacteraceae bacterium]
MLKQAPGLMGRRDLLALGSAAFAVSALVGKQAHAQPAGGRGGPIAPIQRLNDALLTAMREGQQTPFPQRYKQLDPIIAQTFDLPVILAESIGLAWSSLPSEQKADLLAAFRRYTVSSYAANFNNFSGQRFEISPPPRRLTSNEVIVDTKIIPVQGSPNTLDYVMRSESGGWLVTDVLADGSISRVAVQRSDFNQLLLDGGVPALVAGLRHKIADLSGGMMA